MAADPYELTGPSSRLRAIGTVFVGAGVLLITLAVALLDKLVRRD